jgi:hypothetical protein
MSVQYTEHSAVFSEVVGVDEAEALLEWLQANAAARIDLSACTHLHPANLQVLMAARPTITAWPADTGLAPWLRSALGTPATP